MKCSKFANAIACLILTCSIASAADEARRPNVVFILADDLGSAELGCFGQTKIRTPNIDKLAAEGVRFTQHYSGNAVCAPSRCVLMTGKHPGHAFIRNNRETKPEGQFPIPTDTVTLGKLLQQQGYVTGGFGKWGLGGPGSTGEPLKQGINRFFGYNCQGVAHNYYPTSLWDNDRRLPLNNPAFSSKQKFPENLDPKDPANFASYAGKDYAPDLIAAAALRFARENKDRPFLLYYPTTIPHLAIQVPNDSLAEYQGAFEERPYLGDKGFLPHPTPRAAYAAMITRLDRQVGQLVDLIKELGLEEQTIFVFTSDNGPAYDQIGGTDSDFFESAGKLRGRKGSLYEGGIRVPMIARWKGHIPPGGTSDRVTGFEDWLPTLLNLVGAEKAVPQGLDGISFAPTLKGQAQPPRRFLYREFPAYGGQQSVRMGDWKAVRQNLIARGKDLPVERRIELYNLGDDPAETKNVAQAHPEVVASIEKIMREEHIPSADFPFPALDR